MKTAVIIVNYNGRKLLAECLDSLKAQTRQADWIVLVENASTDGSVEFVRANYPQVILLLQERNLGFAEGNNHGFAWLREHARPEAVALMNNDTRAKPRWLESLVSALESEPKLGSAASRMLYALEPGLINDAGDMPLWDGTGLARGRHEPAQAFGQDEEVFGPCAGAAVYRWEALEQTALGGAIFDPDYFAYNEDVDLAWRLRRRGWGCKYVASAEILHHHAATGGRYSTWVLYHGERNRCWTLLKNFSWPIIVVSPFYSAARLLSVLRGSRLPGGTAAGYLKKVSIFSVGWTLIRAWLAALWGAPRMLLKRWNHGLGWTLFDQLKVLKKLGAKLGNAASH